MPRRNAERTNAMKQRVAAIDERERLRRYRQASLGRQAEAAGGPDMGRFMSQLESQGFGGGTSKGGNATHGSGGSQGVNAGAGGAGSGQEGPNDQGGAAAKQQRQQSS